MFFTPKKNYFTSTGNVVRVEISLAMNYYTNKSLTEIDTIKSQPVYFNCYDQRRTLMNNADLVGNIYVADILGQYIKFDKEITKHKIIFNTSENNISTFAPTDDVAQDFYIFEFKHEVNFQFAKNDGTKETFTGDSFYCLLPINDLNYLYELKFTSDSSQFKVPIHMYFSLTPNGINASYPVSSPNQKVSIIKINDTETSGCYIPVVNSNTTNTWQYSYLGLAKDNGKEGNEKKTLALNAHTLFDEHLDNDKFFNPTVSYIDGQRTIKLPLTITCVVDYPVPQST